MKFILAPCRMLRVAFSWSPTSWEHRQNQGAAFPFQPKAPSASAIMAAASCKPVKALAGDSAIHVKKILNSLASLYQPVAAQMGPMQDHVVDSVASIVSNPQQILDLASGTGNPGIQLAQRFPKAKVTLSDPVENMRQQAEARVADSAVSNIEVINLDLADLSLIGTDTQDAVTISLGLFFAAEPAAALVEIKRILKPGGVLVATVWDRTTLLPITEAVMKEVADSAPNNLLHLSNGKIDPLFEEIGLVPTLGHNQVVDLQMNMGRAGEEDTWKICMFPGMATLAQRAESDPDVFARTKTAFERHSAHLVSDGHVKSVWTYRVLAVVKPSTISLS